MASARAIRRTGLLVLLALLIGQLVGIPWLASVPPAAAQATLIVTNGDDTNDGTCDADCSLREAIANAAAGDTISFADGVTTVTLTSATLVISADLTIDGGSGVTIERSSEEGTPEFRIFEITGSNVTLDSLTIRNGSGSGGGILSIGMLTVSSSTLSGNKATNDVGGGIANDGSGEVTVSNSTISDNAARFTRYRHGR
jgi:CSLREA domain-containing protein